MDSCQGGLSNFERKKQSLISANMWKSNFINLWKKYGSFTTIEGKQVFATYRIDGPGEGQKKMSNRLGQKDLWETTQHEDVKRVELWFNLDKLVQVDNDLATAWLEDIKAEVDEEDFTLLRYEIKDGDVVEHGFYKEILNDAGEVVETVPVDDDLYVNISLYIAEKKRDALEQKKEENFSYEEVLSKDEVEALLDTVISTRTDDYGNIYYLDIIDEAIRGYGTEESIGTDILDELVAQGTAQSTVLAGKKTYYLPLESAKKMNSFAFMELISLTLDFNVIKKGGFWRFLKRIFKLVLAAVAIYFQQYWLAASLIVGFVADETNSKVLKVVSALLGLLQGDFSNMGTWGVGEATSLLANVYAVYKEIQAPSMDNKDAQEVGEETPNMFYEAPYDAYDNLYCFESIVEVKIETSS